MASAELEVPVVSDYKRTARWQKDYQMKHASELTPGEHWAEVLLPDAMIKPYVDVDIRKPTPDQTVEAVREVWEPALREAFPSSSSDPPAGPGRAPCGIASSPRVASIETTLAPQLAPTQKLAWHEGGPKGLGHLWDSRGQPMLDQ